MSVNTNSILYQIGKTVKNAIDNGVGTVAGTAGGYNDFVTGFEGTGTGTGTGTGGTTSGTISFASSIAAGTEQEIAALTGYDVGTYALNSDGSAFYVYDGTNWNIFNPYN